ncbi:sugar nucleotidyltransferase [Patescibacteria group bacterium]
MKGIILAGGAGTRLHPITKVTSKQLLPIYDRPMIYYPLQTLLNAGIKEILIIVAPENAGDYLKLLGSGKEFKAKFAYEIQDKPEGLAQAFIIGETFIGDDNVTMILGDNLFLADTGPITQAIQNFKSGGIIITREVNDPERFGVAKFDDKGELVEIIEKPKDPPSNQAVTGLYVYDNRIIKFAQQLKPSARGELEITDLNNIYLKNKELQAIEYKGKWLDTGTFDTLLDAANHVAELNRGSKLF